MFFENVVKTDTICSDFNVLPNQTMIKTTEQNEEDDKWKPQTESTTLETIKHGPNAMSLSFLHTLPDSKVYGANMGPIWSRQDPGGSHVGTMNLAIWDLDQHNPLQWRHESDVVSNHRRLDCLLNHLFRRRSKKTSKFRVTGLCEGKSPVTGVFP